MDDVDPRLANPIAIFTLRVHRIPKVTETVLGPAVFVIVHALLKKGGIAVLIPQEERVSFGGNCEAVHLPLFARFRVIVVPFNLEDRARLVSVGAEFHKTRRNLIYLFPGQRPLDSVAVWHLERPPGQGTNPPFSVATIAIESVSSMTYVP